MTIYYKATRPDGTDFYSGTVTYAVGKLVRPKTTRSDGQPPRLCGPGLLHAATQPDRTFVGGRGEQWPCRLFEVEGKVVDGLNVSHPYKAGFRQVKVVREIDAWRVMGPHGEDVVRVIDEWVEHATAAACYNSGDQTWARDRAQAWARARARNWDRARAWDRAWDRAQAQAQAWDASLAWLVKDLISDADFHLLVDPWEAFMATVG